VGGGAFPGVTLPTTLVRLAPGALGAHGLALRLRLGNPPVIARALEEAVVLDPRTIGEEELEALGGALAAVTDQQ
jgi:L-seryl-tRNA(Ser) seleniumtransferase